MDSSECTRVASIQAGVTAISGNKRCTGQRSVLLYPTSSQDRLPGRGDDYCKFLQASHCHSILLKSQRMRCSQLYVIHVYHLDLHPMNGVEAHTPRSAGSSHQSEAKLRSLSTVDPKVSRSCSCGAQNSVDSNIFLSHVALIQVPSCAFSINQKGEA